ncbi:hypothetical protein GCM10010254_12910 [Streptomyces chromofuscus]|nr:hypothetical protein GCM10010254_12910 [Streptomyces chromofuscus]
MALGQGLPQINGEQKYLWRAVDADGNVLDILVQNRRDTAAARRFFRTLLTKTGAGLGGPVRRARAPALPVSCGCTTWPSLPSSTTRTAC